MYVFEQDRALAEKLLYYLDFHPSRPGAGAQDRVYIGFSPLNHALSNLKDKDGMPRFRPVGAGLTQCAQQQLLQINLSALRRHRKRCLPPSNTWRLPASRDTNNQSVRWSRWRGIAVQYGSHEWKKERPSTPPVIGEGVRPAAALATPNPSLLGAGEPAQHGRTNIASSAGARASRHCATGVRQS